VRGPGALTRLMAAVLSVLAAPIRAALSSHSFPLGRRQLGAKQESFKTPRRDRQCYPRHADRYRNRAHYLRTDLREALRCRTKAPPPPAGCSCLLRDQDCLTFTTIAHEHTRVGGI